jgi:hypothetical protein
MCFMVNENVKFRGSHFRLLLSPFYPLLHIFSYHSYQKDERVKTGNLVTSDVVAPPPSPYTSGSHYSFALNFLPSLSFCQPLSVFRGSVVISPVELRSHLHCFPLFSYRTFFMLLCVYAQWQLLFMFLFISLFNDAVGQLLLCTMKDG